MKIFRHALMTPKEREDLDKLDNLILNSTHEELKKIQEIDYQTQLEGSSFYDVYLDSSSLINQSVNYPKKEK